MLSNTGTGSLALAGSWTVRVIFGPFGLSPIWPTTSFMIAVPPRAAASVSLTTQVTFGASRGHATKDFIAVILEDLGPALT